MKSNILFIRFAGCPVCSGGGPLGTVWDYAYGDHHDCPECDYLQDALGNTYHDNSLYKGGGGYIEYWQAKGMTGREMSNMCHMLGIDRHGKSYCAEPLGDKRRNYWCADVGDKRFDRLIDLGYVTKTKINQSIFPKMENYHATEEGFQMLFSILMRMRMSVRLRLNENIMFWNDREY